MDQRQYNYTQLGMLFGIIVGSGMGTILFASSGQPLYFTLSGVGLVIGLVLGTGLDKRL